MKNYQEIIYAECMSKNGFAWRIRENVVDEESYERLITALKGLTEQHRERDTIDRLTVASLFELPWEMENTVEHYTQIDEQLGRRDSSMADHLRALINELLWVGLEEHYENI